jgi:hypothetical protein
VAASVRGKAPAVPCMETQSPFLVVNLCFITNLENNSFGLKLEANGLIMVKIVLYGGHHLVRSDTVILADRNLDRTVRGNYGPYPNNGLNSNITA